MKPPGRRGRTQVRVLALVQVLIALGGSANAGGERTAGTRVIARVSSASETYRGFRIDLSEVPARQRRRYFDSLHAQIDLVEGLAIKPAIQAFFRTVTIHIDPAMDHGGRATRGELFLAASEMPPDNPVLLHELIHIYHREKLPDGKRNADLLRFYERAKASGDFPADAYMLKNVGEYFAMTGSVVLYGRASRPPSTRESVKRVQPQLYAWIVREFGLQP